jgi:HrpA-like RNA helicase
LNTKSLNTRQADRSRASLPIFAKQNEICQRLEAEKVLVVTAATGSGKQAALLSCTTIAISFYCR